ncbi:MAG: hypothetical protein KDM63_09595 [Verrucomicrobiae bacterium]|nr:hypothetical protein [Verrucomicrobiae bacterium]
MENANAGRRDAVELRRMIDRVFALIPKPTITFRVARALDDEWPISPKRAAELSLEDPETDWRDVSKEMTEAYQEDFTFADSPRWRFYLPAFMTHCFAEFPQGRHDASIEHAANVSASGN